MQLKNIKTINTDKLNIINAGNHNKIVHHTQDKGIRLNPFKIHNINVIIIQ